MQRSMGHLERDSIVFEILSVWTSRGEDSNQMVPVPSTQGRAGSDGPAATGL